MPILMKYEGIDGESAVEGFTKHIELQSAQFGVGRGIASARGASTREGSDASISELVVTKVTDGTSVKLLEESLTGKLNKVVEIKWVRTGAGKPDEYLSFKLEGCGLSGYSLSSGGDRPSESLSLNFDKVTFKYNPIGDDFTGNPAHVGWDLAMSKKM